MWPTTVTQICTYNTNITTENCKRLERGAFRARVELLDEIFPLFPQWMSSCVRLPASCVVYAHAPPATESAAVPDGVCFEVVPGIISQRGCKSQPLATFGEKGVPLVCTRSTVRRQSRRSTRWPREPRKQSRAARRRISPIQSQHYPGSNVTISGVNCTFGSPLGYRSALRTHRLTVQIVSRRIWTSYAATRQA